MFNITHRFINAGESFAFDFRNIFFCKLDRETEKELDNYLLRENIPSLSNENNTPLGIYMSHGFFLSNEPERSIPPLYYNSINISFAPVHNCNFACKYCYAQGGKGTDNYLKSFDKSSIEALINYIYYEKYSSYSNYKFDFVSGGEPLLNFEILEYFLERIRQIDKELNKSTVVFIVTNGSLLTPDIIQRLDRLDVFLGISIDGNEEQHNFHRVYKNGSGTYNDVVQGIECLRKSNSGSRTKDAWALAVITKKTGNLVTVMETCINLGFQRMQMQLLRGSDDDALRLKLEDVDIIKQNYLELFAHLLSYAKKGDLSRLKMIANDNDSFGKYISRLLLRTPVYYRCFAGKNKISIAANGDVYPCDSFCGLNEFIMDSIYNPKATIQIKQMFEQAHVCNREPCAKCWARFICGGDCFHNSYKVNGNICDPDPFICEINRFFIEQAIVFLIHLWETDKRLIEYLVRFLRASNLPF